MIDRSQPIRSAITVAGIVAHSASCSRIAGSAASAIEPLGARWYRGTSSARSARRTVFFEIPSFPRDRLDRQALRPVQAPDLSPLIQSNH